MKTKVDFMKRQQRWQNARVISKHPFHGGTDPLHRGLRGDFELSTSLDDDHDMRLCVRGVLASVAYFASLKKEKRLIEAVRCWQ